MKLVFSEHSLTDCNGCTCTQFMLSQEQLLHLSRFRSARLKQHPGASKAVHEAMEEVVAWCYEQFGTPLVGRWSCSTLSGFVEIRDPNEALAFKMRWL